MKRSGKNSEFLQGSPKGQPYKVVKNGRRNRAVAPPCIRAKRSMRGGWGGGGGTSGEPLKRERAICVKNGAIIRNTSFVVTYVTNDILTIDSFLL